MLLLVTEQILPQKNDIAKNRFTINGKLIGRDTGSIILSNYFISSEYSEFPININSTLNKGNFSFEGELTYPTAVRIGQRTGTGNHYLSGLFFINKGVQSTILNFDSTDVTPVIYNSPENYEYKEIYLKQFTVIQKEEDELEDKIDNLSKKYKDNIPDSLSEIYELMLKKISMKKDTILYDYVKSNPFSYVGLWVLIEKFCLTGYKHVYEDIYNLFSDTLKGSYTGKTLSKKLTIAKSTSIINIFPFLYLKDIHNNTAIVSHKKSSSYTLIDFWFSHCGPCKREFPQMLKLYTAYRAKGFNIIGISVDKKNDGKDWELAIKENGLIWPQYWDIDGKEAKNFSINSYPTTFLLDSSGKIIAKNMETAQLAVFLKNHFSQ